MSNEDEAAFPTRAAENQSRVRTDRAADDSPRTGWVVKGAIFVGGSSRRMGTPKAALVFRDRRLIDHAVDLLVPFVRTMTLVGRFPEGLVQPTIAGATPMPVDTLSDDPATRGPLAGVVAVLASDPSVDWLCIPCDMPGLTREAIRWLLDQHDPHNTATIGLLPGRGEPEPFPAVYGPSAIEPVQSFIRTGGTALRGALAAMNACVRPVPAQLLNCWQNVNTPLEWDRFSERDSHLSAEHNG